MHVRIIIILTLLQGSLIFLLPNLPGCFFVTCTEIRSNKMVLPAIPGFSHTSPPTDTCTQAVPSLRNVECGWAGGWWGTRGLYTDLRKWKDYVSTGVKSQNDMPLWKPTHHSPVHMPLTHSYLYLVQAIYTEGDIVLLCTCTDINMWDIERKGNL